MRYFLQKLGKTQTFLLLRRAVVSYLYMKYYIRNRAAGLTKSIAGRSCYAIACLTFLFLLGCSIRPLYHHADRNASKVASNIDVDVIAEREGQKLRSYLIDIFRDIDIFSKLPHRHFRLQINLSSSEKQYAFSTDGNAKRIKFSHVAQVVLLDENQRKLMDREITVSVGHNISHSQGEISLSIYGRNSETLLKELAHKILENIKMVLENET
ncbi:MAG: hypothetical protein LBB29_02295 [Holosporaceae bacterium]|jgi:hypothetical protein|nr:hypothetical protein [Holosporaceae bacterium]